MSRKMAREVAFKYLFETAFQKDESLDELTEMLLTTDEEEREDITPEDKKYIDEITNGINEKETEINEAISKHLKGWTMERISKVDIAILKLAIYEILYREDIPYKVSINEAVELAKTFSDESSPSFINGVLAEIVNEKS